MPYDKRPVLLSLCLLGLTLTVSQRLFPPSDAWRTDIMIVSPHPDDATLCCAGLIQQSLGQGKRIRVVEMTDGDGYEKAAALFMHKPAVSPTDMIQLGRVRGREERRAMNLLGISRFDLTFLGYPDGWLNEVFHADETSPFSSSYTRLSRSPHSGHPYTRSAVIRDLSLLLTRYRPRQVYVSGIVDGTLDHQVTYRFVDEAIRASGYTGQLRTYVIHATDSASPSAAQQIRLMLTPEERQTKTDAIGLYDTQVYVDDDYLQTFARDTELFY